VYISTLIEALANVDLPDDHICNYLRVLLFMDDASLKAFSRANLNKLLDATWRWSLKWAVTFGLPK
jgi:hypothetical protein